MCLYAHEKEISWAWKRKMELYAHEKEISWAWRRKKQLYAHGERMTYFRTIGSEFRSNKTCVYS